MGVVLQEDIKPTVGEAASKLLINPDKNQEVGETSQAMNKTYEEELISCIEKYKKNRASHVPPHFQNEVDLNGPFYAVVIARKERLIANSARRQFLCRETEPKPEYDQTVYKVNPKTQEINFKWVIPDIESYHDMVMFGQNYPIDQQELVGFCRAMNENRLADYQRIQLVS